MFIHSKFDLGSETARHLGPTPRGRLKFGRVLACPTQVAWTDGTVAYTSRKGRASVCHRAVERRFRAIFPEGMADSDTLGL